MARMSIIFMQVASGILLILNMVSSWEEEQTLQEGNICFIPGQITK